eukprot:139347-Prymnesium_polylepis.2
MAEVEQPKRKRMRMRGSLGRSGDARRRDGDSASRLGAAGPSHVLELCSPDGRVPGRGGRPSFSDALRCRPPGADTRSLHAAIPRVATLARNRSAGTRGGRPSLSR